MGLGAQPTGRWVVPPQEKAFQPKKRGGASGFTIQFKKPDGTVMHVVPTDTTVRKGKGDFPCEHCGKVLDRPSGLSTHRYWCKGKGKGMGPAAVPQRSLLDKHKVRATAYFFVCERQFRIHLWIAQLFLSFLLLYCLGPVLWRRWAWRAGSASPSG